MRSPAPSRLPAAGTSHSFTAAPCKPLLGRKHQIIPKISFSLLMTDRQEVGREVRPESDRCRTGFGSVRPSLVPAKPDFGHCGPKPGPNFESVQIQVVLESNHCRPQSGVRTLCTQTTTISATSQLRSSGGESTKLALWLSLTKHLLFLSSCFTTTCWPNLATTHSHTNIFECPLMWQKD